MALLLASWAVDSSAVVTCVECEPTAALRARASQSPELELVARPGPEALNDLEPADIYVIAGDRNYHSTRAWLEAIDGQRPVAASSPLLLVHGVGWPTGRRDSYRDPAALPQNAVHPLSFKRGPVPGRGKLARHGIGAEDRGLAYARHEGGAGNGVLTAVEDYLSVRGELAFAHVPGLFGLGAILPEHGPLAESLRAWLARYDCDPLLRRLEAEQAALRIELSRAAGELEARQQAERRRGRPTLERPLSALRALRGRRR